MLIEELRKFPITTHMTEEQVADLRQKIATSTNLLERALGVIRHLKGYPYTAFITAQSDEVMEGNLPKYLLVCPAYGCDFSVRYEYAN